VFNWVLAIALLPHPWSRWNKVQNYLLGPLLSLPLVPMACFDTPRRQPWIWQVLLLCCIWVSAAGNIIDMRICDYYSASKHCGNRDFMGTLYYASALPVIGLFALGQKRSCMVLAALAWLVLVAATILPVRPSFVRNVLNVLVFQGFLVYTHYAKELADRRMYTMRAELKVQFRAKQKAQINERKTMDSKRRFSSYIFHEVRVPLNTALLAVQNLEGANVFDKSSEQAVEYAALEGSLQMMSQVLNDVLDFSRMERGGFSSVSRPFSLHAVMRSIFVPLKLDTHARGLDLETYLDPRIDQVAKYAAFPEESQNGPVREAEGFMMGDEMRLRQIINNLASNASKFTSTGGKVSIKTTLVYPSDLHPVSEAEIEAAAADADHAEDPQLTTSTAYSPRLSAGRLQQHEERISPPSREILVARIEITDTGVGIRSRDMAENRLFSAYVQTEIGRNQGGKGTGLGLSLVRQIVMLSGGRLGVKSKVGQGSTFWVEMPFAIGPQTRKTDHLEPHRRVSSTLDKKDSISAGSSAGDSADLKFVPTLAAVDQSTSSARQGEDGSAIEMTQIPPQFRYISPPGSPDPGAEAPGPVGTRSTAVSSGAATLVAPDPVRPGTHHVVSAPALVSTSNPSSGLGLGLGAKPKSQALVFADGPLRVLVVDDDALTRRLMSRMMERLGCIVGTAENGLVALEKMLEDKTNSLGGDGAGSPAKKVTFPGELDPRLRDIPKNFEITLLDNQMPKCSGLQVVNRMRSIGRDDLIIGVTANALLSDQELYLEQGASFILTKPVLEVDLRRFLTIADKRRAERNARAARGETAVAAEEQAVSRPPLPLSLDSEEYN